MAEALIVSAVRTAIARAPGALQELEPEVFGAEVMKVSRVIRSGSAERFRPPSIRS